MASRRHIKTRVFCKVTQKMVDKGDELHEGGSSGPMVMGPLEPFISPITGEEITNRAQLRRHNRDNGVTDRRDYSQEWYEVKQKENYRKSIGDTPEDRRDRIETIKRAMHRR